MDISLTRRRFIGQTAVVIGGAYFGAPFITSAEGKSVLPLIVSTWPFGKAANEEALRVLARGGSLLDAVEQGIWVTESAAPDNSVGLGGKPNAAGVVQLDACIMYGPGHKAGSVAGLEGIRHPISVARRVMEKTKHVMLVGEGARMFALEEGLESIPVDTRAQYEKWQSQRKDASGLGPGSAGKPEPGHDTIALIILGANGDVAGGCSTSGLGGKLPGRVGDSPILGSGLYVDNEAGAAGATGVGENVMRYCATYRIVELMRKGMHPGKACLQVIQEIAKVDPKPLKDLHINFVALDKQGRYGAAGTDPKFQFAVTTHAESKVLPNPAAAKLKL